MDPAQSNFRLCIENQKSSVRFLPRGSVVFACRCCSELYEAEVAQGTSLEGYKISLLEGY